MKKITKWSLVSLGLMGLTTAVVAPTVVSCSSSEDTSSSYIPTQNKNSVYAPSANLAKSFTKQDYDSFSNTWADGSNSINISYLGINVSCKNYWVHYIYVKDNYFFIPVSVTLNMTIPNSTQGINSPIFAFLYGYYYDSTTNPSSSNIGAQDGLYTGAYQTNPLFNRATTLNDAINEFKKLWSANTIQWSSDQNASTLKTFLRSLSATNQQMNSAISIVNKNPNYQGMNISFSPN